MTINSPWQYILESWVQVFIIQQHTPTGHPGPQNIMNETEN